MLKFMMFNLYRILRQDIEMQLFTANDTQTDIHEWNKRLLTS